MTESFNCQWFPKQEKDHFQKFHIREFGASAWHPSDHSDYQTTWQWEAMPWHTRTSTDCNAGIGAHGRNSSRGSPKAAAYVLQDAERVCQSPLRPEKHKLHLVLIPFSVQHDVWDSARTSDIMTVFTSHCYWVGAPSDPAFSPPDKGPYICWCEQTTGRAGPIPCAIPLLHVPSLENRGVNLMLGAVLGQMSGSATSGGADLEHISAEWRWCCSPTAATNALSSDCANRTSVTLK